MRRLRVLRPSVGLLLVLAMLVWPGAAAAAVFNVTGTADSVAACSGSSCPSLRSAVLASDAAGGTNTINVPAAQYKLTRTPSGSDDGHTGDLHITTNTTITGAGANSGGTTIVGDKDRVFDIFSGASNVTLSRMTITGGSNQIDGGGVHSIGGSLTLKNDVLSSNTTTTNGGSGGAVSIEPSGPGSLTMSNTVFLSNIAAENGSSGGGFGGAIIFEPSTTGTMKVENTEFDSNQAQSGTTDGGGFGGAISFLTGDTGT